jgi:hypothetical protein
LTIPEIAAAEILSPAYVGKLLGGLQVAPPPSPRRWSARLLPGELSASRKEVDRIARSISFTKKIVEVKRPAEKR